MFHTTRTLTAILFALPLAPPSGAQVASAMLHQGDPVGGAVVSPGGNFGYTTVNSTGGFATRVSLWDGSAHETIIWGNASGGTGMVLKTPSKIGAFDQVSIGPAFGLDDSGSLLYTADDTVTGPTDVSAVFRDNSILSMTGDPVPGLPSKEFKSLTFPKTTPSGLGYWTAYFGDPASTALEGTALVTEAGVVLHKTGDLIAGLPVPLGKYCIRSKHFSSQGSHYIVNAESAVLLDGVPLTTNAGLISPGVPVPASAGGLPGEVWGSFGTVGVNESGDTMVTGVNFGVPLTSRKFLMRNGKIVYRQGDIVSGETLLGGPVGAVLGEGGDIAYTWQGVGGGSKEAVFLNSKLLVMEGDAIDWDDDGVIEPTSILNKLWGNTLSIGPDRSVYFMGAVSLSGSSDQLAYFRIDESCTSAAQKFGAGCIGNYGLAPVLDLDGCFAGGSNVSLQVSQGEPLGVAGFLFGPGPGEIPLGGSACALNLSGLFGPILVLPLDASGAASLPLTLGGLAPGLSFAIQSFSSDSGSALGFAVSNGLEIIVD